MKTKKSEFIFDSPIVVKGDETLRDGESLNVSYTINPESIEIKMEKSYTEKLPARLEAFDAEESSDGWAVDVADLLDWANHVLSETAENHAGARKFVEALKRYLSGAK